MVGLKSCGWVLSRGRRSRSLRRNIRVCKPLRCHMPHVPPSLPIVFHASWFGVVRANRIRK